MSATREQTTLEQIITLDEKTARITGRCLYGRELEQMRAEQLESLLEIIKRESAEKAARNDPANCFHYGRPNYGDTARHIWCKEGMSINEYNRVHRNSF